VYAIAPQNTEKRERDEGEDGSKCGQDHRACALYGRLDDGVEGIESALPLVLICPNQDQRIAHQNAGEPDQPED